MRDERRFNAECGMANAEYRSQKGKTKNSAKCRMEHIKDKSLWIVSVFLLALLTFPQQTPQTYAQQEGGEFLAGVPANFPPQYSIDPQTGKPAGFAIDVMDEIARRSGIKVRYVVYPDWEKTNEAMERGEVVLIPNAGIIAERQELRDFTSPLETFHIVIFVRETTINIKSVEDLKGKEVAVVELNKGRYLMEERGGSKLQIYNSPEEAFLSLVSGKSGALVFPKPPIILLSREIGHEDKIKIVGEPLLEVKRSIAVRKGNYELLKKLDDEVRTFTGTPRYAEIYFKWYGKPNRCA
jgi:ABC-type amino acid transport substrate-binding protein